MVEEILGEGEGEVGADKLGLGRLVSPYLTKVTA